MSEVPKYCQHFEYLKISQHLSVDRDAACKYCMNGSANLWMCLSKNCWVYACAKNNMEHLKSHLDESRRNKKFHSIFINLMTVEIICIQCGIEIGDLDIPSNAGVKGKQDPFTARLKLQPSLQFLITPKIVGQLQNSQGHKKISGGLVGLFTNKYNYSINAAIQFVAHCSFVKSLLLSIKISESNSVLKALREVVQGIESADYRAVESDAVSQILYKQFPHMWGYKRKDPFESIIYFINKINEQTLFYSLSTVPSSEDLDEWDMFYKKNMLRPHHLIYSAIESTLSLNYRCAKCNKEVSVPHNIQFLKLNIPKKKRKAREVERQLASHRYESPVKNRRKSLMNFFVEEECPLTIPQLIIQLMKSPIQRQQLWNKYRLNCQVCSESMKRLKLHFQKLPEILMIQISRFSKDGCSFDRTPIELSVDSLDLGSFTSRPEQQVFYDFQCAICIEKQGFFPLLMTSRFNKQKYVIRNEVVQICKEKMNPYIICYKKRTSESARQKLLQIRDDLNSQRQKKFMLPDFWHLQLENGIERPFRNQLVCKHNYLKPGVESKLIKPVKVSKSVYEDLHHFYREQTVENSARPLGEGSPVITARPFSSFEERQDVYNNEVCDLCLDEIEQLNYRRKKQRQFVTQYDKLKGQNLPYCMVSASWIRRWSNFLYNKQYFAYMPKGFPLPLSIDNKVLLDGNKCKPNLVKNEDFRVLNIYLWKFLRELYGGGPEIRYKWKEGRESLDDEMIQDIKSKAVDLKLIYCSSYLQSPKKLMTSLSYIQKSSIMQESAESPFRQVRMMQELQEEER